MPDPVKNFAIAPVAGLYSSGAVTIILQTGFGVRFPQPAADGDYDCVYWNATDYLRASDDPFRELVTVTARTGDTLTITRGQQGTAASAKNISGKVYMLAEVMDKKKYDELADLVGANTGGFTMEPTKMYGGRLQSQEIVELGQNGIVLDEAGLRLYSAALGKTVDFPTDGGVPFIAGLATTPGTEVVVGLTEDIQAAIDFVDGLGGGIVHLHAGTYFVSNDLVIPSGVKLQGVGIFETILDFGGLGFSVRIEGIDAYSVGTVSVVQDSTTVTGAGGLTFSSAMIGQSILIDGDFYEVASVTDTTHLEIAAGFSGVTQSGLSYVVVTVNNFAEVSYLTVQNSSADLITVKYTYGTQIYAVARYAGDRGIYVQDAGAVVVDNGEGAESNTDIFFSNVQSFSIKNEFSYNCISDGVVLQGGGDATIFNWSSSNNGGVGLKLTNVTKLGVLSFTVDTNASHGIYLASGCDDNNFTSGSVHDNVVDGVRIAATSNRNNVKQVQFQSNAGYGINIAAASCVNNEVKGNQYLTNTLGTLNDAGVDTIREDTDVTLAANSDYRTPTQKAIKAYVDAKPAGDPLGMQVFS